MLSVSAVSQPDPVPPVDAPASPAQSAKLGKTPAMLATVLRHLTFVTASVWLIYQGGWATEPLPAGDSIEYILMTKALWRHGTPDLRPGDAQTPEIEKQLAIPPKAPKTFLVGFISTADRQWFSWHFFFYPVLNLPMTALTIVTQTSPLRPFPLTNAIFMICAVGQMLYATRYPFGLQLVGVAMIVWSSCLWYLAWPHPEVMTCIFVFMSLICWFHEQRYRAILLAALATMQNPPLFLLVLYYLLPTVFRRTPNIILNTFICGIASFWVILPPLFYRYHYGVGSLIVEFGYLDKSFITLQRLWGFFFDLNQGMILAMPTAFPVFLVAYIAAAYSTLRHGFHRMDRRAAYQLLLIPTLIAMTFFIMPMRNWNHGQSVINRYSSWCSMIPLAYLVHLLSYRWNSWRFWTSVIFIVVPQALVITHYGGTHVHEGAYLQHKELPLFLLNNAPRLYNPDVDIFIRRTLHTYEDPPPPIAVFYGKDLTIRKLAIRKGFERELLKHGWTEKQVARVAREAHFAHDWTYLHPGDYQDSKSSR